MDAEVLVEVTRGGIVESLHRGHLIVVDGDGRVVCRAGEPETVTFLRSAAKPFQALPFLLSGAAERFGFSEREIALACASHSGEVIHTVAAARMIQKIGLSESDLRCGAHYPFDDVRTREMIRRDEYPSQLHNNCSGKHAAMLAFALQLGADIKTYEHLENPIQQEILKTVALFAGLKPEEVALGVDGCAAPNFAVSIEKMALMFARLANPPASFPEDLRAACARVVQAMTTHPEMVGGEQSARLDTLIMKAARGQVVSKIGAEGVYTAGVLPSAKWQKGLGIALKIEDGSDRRARPVAVLEVLRKLEILNPDEDEALKAFARVELKNHRGDVVGEVRPVFALQISE